MYLQNTNLATNDKSRKKSLVGITNEDVLRCHL